MTRLGYPAHSHGKQQGDGRLAVRWERLRLPENKPKDPEDAAGVAHLAAALGVHAAARVALARGLRVPGACRGRQLGAVPRHELAEVVRVALRQAVLLRRLGVPARGMRRA